MHKVVIPEKKRSMPASQRAAIGEAARERHAARRAATKDRDDRIIKHYVEDDMGMSHIAAAMGIAQATVQKIVNRAQREGLLKIRSKNRTLARPGR